MKIFEYILEPYAGIKTRHQCPRCKTNNVFVRFIVKKSGEYVAESVGRCNREIACGYQYSPRAYFRDNPGAFSRDKPCIIPSHISANSEITPKPIAYINFELYRHGLKNYEHNNFVNYLNSLFGYDITKALLKKYFVGTSKHWQGATSFPQIDTNGNIRQIKIMDYDAKTGKRKKSDQESWKLNYKANQYLKDIGYGDKIFFAGKKILKNSEANLKQCFFGEHLLAQSYKPVAIVESEKTALIASAYLPEFIWLATGGINGCKWSNEDVYQALKGRDVILFPDVNAYDVWTSKSKGLATVAKSVSFSNLLEERAREDERKAGLDLADYLARFPIGDFEKIREANGKQD